MISSLRVLPALAVMLAVTACVSPRPVGLSPARLTDDYVPAERVTARPLQILVREYAYGGDEVRVQVLHQGKPVWEPTEEPGVQGVVRGVRVEFAGMTKETDSDGVAVFRVPKVHRPEAFVVDVWKSGYASYMTHSINGRRFAFPIFPAVYAFQPPGILFDLRPELKTKLKRVEILDAVAFHEAGLDPTNVEEKLKGTGAEYVRETSCSKRRVLESLCAAGPGSVWVFHGHGNDSNNDGKTDSLVSDSNEVITLQDLCTCLGDSPPDVVILSGCGDADFLQQLKACGPKLVLGFDRKVVHGNAAAAVRDLLEGLLDGEKTLTELINDATKKGRVRAGAMISDPDLVTVTFCGYPPPGDAQKLDSFLSDPPQ